MSDEEYEVEKIVEVKTKKNKPLYLIRWKGYGPEEDSWEPASNLTNCDELLRRFYESNPTKAPQSTKSSPSIKSSTVTKRRATQNSSSPAPESRIKSRSKLNSKFQDPEPFVNGTVQSSHSTIAELVKSSFDISPLNLRDEIGRYPTINEIRDYAKQKSLNKMQFGDERQQIEDVEEIKEYSASGKNYSWWRIGNFAFITCAVLITLSVMWVFFMWLLNLQSIKI